MIILDRCLICHRKLKDDVSKKRGIGPTCWRRVMKVVKADREKRRAKMAHSRRISGELKGQITFFDTESIQEDDYEQIPERKG